jgi:hypothetical protein
MFVSKGYSWDSEEERWSSDSMYRLPFTGIVFSEMKAGGLESGDLPPGDFRGFRKKDHKI